MKNIICFLLLLVAVPVFAQTRIEVARGNVTGRQQFPVVDVPDTVSAVGVFVDRQSFVSAPGRELFVVIEELKGSEWKFLCGATIPSGVITLTGSDVPGGSRVLTHSWFLCRFATKAARQIRGSVHVKQGAADATVSTVIELELMP